ncbi:MAG: hypothetical protein ACRBCK_04395 [Alphaproteobacteria bacterium]
MKRTQYILTIFLMAITLPAVAKSPSFVSGTGAKVSVVRNGIPVQVRKEDAQEMANRVASIFNSHTSNTTQTWYRQSMEQRGMDPAEKWIDLKNSSHVSIRLEEKKDSENSDTDIQEILQGINEKSADGFFGITLAQLRNGEIHAYRVKGKEMISFYCLDKVGKYLPDHYDALRDRYNTPEYKEAGIACSTEEMKN